MSARRQVVNLSALGGDAGISHNTARAWLSVLEASFVVFRVPPWHRNLRKRLIRAPKLHFFDSGLACHLLGIESPDQLRNHPLRGAIFESWVASEVYKGHAHRGITPRLYHVRDRRGMEVDLLVEEADSVRLIEMKSGATVSAEAFEPLRTVAAWVANSSEHRPPQSALVYGGDEAYERSDAQVVPWSSVDHLSDTHRPCRRP